MLRVLLLLLVIKSVQASGPLAFHCNSEATKTPFGDDSIGLCYTLDDKQEGSISWQPQLDTGVIENVSGLSYSDILKKVKATSATGRMPTIKELASIVSYSNDSPFQHYQLLDSWLASLPANSVLLSSTYRAPSPGVSNHDGLLGINITSREIQLVSGASHKYVFIANPSVESYAFRMKQGSNCIDRHTGGWRIQAYDTCRNGGDDESDRKAQQWVYDPVTGMLSTNYQRELGINCAYKDGVQVKRIACDSNDTRQQWDFIDQAFRPRSDHSLIIEDPGSTSHPLDLVTSPVNEEWDFDYWSDL
jgi:hypothetical protein